MRHTVILPNLNAFCPVVSDANRREWSYLCIMLAKTEIFVPQVFALVVSGVFGLIWGSFSNVLIYRVPKGISLLWPPSACPHCLTPVKLWHNVPVLGWVFLRGRCAHCHTLISGTYPLVEALTALLAVSAAWFALPQTGGPGAWNWIPLLLAVWIAVNMPALFAVDFSHKLIPDTISLGGILLGFAIAWLPGGMGWQSALLGILLAGGGLWAFSWIMGKFLRRDAMGFGDIKLVAGFGALLGAGQAVAATILASFLALVCYFALGRFLFKNKENAEIPFGPFLQVGALLIILWGDFLLGFYWSLFS